MREIMFANGSIVAPDNLCFAFNRNIITVNAQTEYVDLEITLDKVYHDRRYLNKYNTVIDVSAYLQAAFNISPEQDLITTKEVEISLVSDQDEKIILFFTVVWGALTIGETFNGDRAITYFRNWPQTVSMYVNSGDLVSIYNDNEGIKESAIIGYDRIEHINLSDIFQKVNNYGEIWIDLEDSDVLGSVFTYQFDGTFFNKTGRTTVKVYVDDSTCGLFLRWIDRHGFYQYYLFMEGDKLYKSSDIGDDMKIHTSILPETLWPYYGIVRNQGKAMQQTVKACALGLNKEMFDLVMGLVSSPIVHLYINETWLPVKIVAGTYTQTDEELQDFEIQIQLPATDVQRL